MSVGTAVGPASGRRHETGFYASDAEFRAMILPWVEDGIAAGEPVIIGYDERKSALLRSWLSRPSDVTFVTGHYVGPAKAIATWRRNYHRYFAEGAARIRAAGDVPHADDRDQFAGWDRYEIALNSVWGDMPVWSRCLYDATTTPSAVRDVVERAHPLLVNASGKSQANPRYQDASVFQGLTPARHRITVERPPVVDLVDPTPAEARHAVTRAGTGLIAESVLDDLSLAVSEVVTNAHVHGRPPITLCLWAVPGSLVVQLSDAGAGMRDPLAGLVPTTSETGAGLGLWITHQLDLAVDLLHDPDGFTVQLCAASPGFAA